LTSELFELVDRRSNILFGRARVNGTEAHHGLASQRGGVGECETVFGHHLDHSAMDFIDLVFRTPFRGVAKCDDAHRSRGAIRQRSDCRRTPSANSAISKPRLIASRNAAAPKVLNESQSFNARNPRVSCTP